MEGGIIPDDVEIVPRGTIFGERRRANLDLLELACFVVFTLAEDYGYWWLVSANGDFGLGSGMVPHGVEQQILAGMTERKAKARTTADSSLRSE